LASDEDGFGPVRCAAITRLDATRGHYLSADFSWAAKALGGNTSFMRFQSTYHTYYKIGGPARGTVLAGNLSVGLAQLFDVRDRNGTGYVDDFDRCCPSVSGSFRAVRRPLRGFPFEEAGPAPGDRAGGRFP
jgi:hypothetical protein